MSNPEREQDVEARLTVLASAPVPPPDERSVATLIASLQPAVRVNRQAAFSEALAAVTAAPSAAVRSPGARWVGLALAQVSLLRPAFWLATALIAAVGAVALASGASSLFVLLAPALAAVGVVIAFRPEATGTWEIELACPVQPFEWLMARFGVVVAYDLLLLAVFTPLLTLGGAATLVASVSLAWLGPLLLLAGLALQASLRWGHIAGISLPLLAWSGLYGFFRRLTSVPLTSLPQLTDLAQPAAMALWLAAFVAGVILIARTPRAAVGWGGMIGEA